MACVIFYAQTMTNEETAKFYAQREAYRWKCEDFKEELFKYLQHYEPRNTNHLPKLRARIRRSPALACVPEVRA